MKKTNDITRIVQGRYYDIPLTRKLMYSVLYVLGSIVMTPFIMLVLLFASAIILAVAFLLAVMSAFWPLYRLYALYLEVWHPPAAAKKGTMKENGQIIEAL